MTLSEFKLRFNQFKLEALQYVKARSPYRLGNLRNSIKYKRNEDGFSIIIDISYVQYTEEAWTFNSHWGKLLPNPNEGWLLECFVRLANEFAKTLKGVVINVN